MRALIGAIVGLVLGIVADGAIWVWAFSQALSGHAGLSVPFIVATQQDGSDVVAASGPGVLLLPFAAALIGALVGLAIRPSRNG